MEPKAGRQERSKTAALKFPGAAKPEIRLGGKRRRGPPGNSKTRDPTADHGTLRVFVIGVCRRECTSGSNKALQKTEAMIRATRPDAVIQSKFALAGSVWATRPPYCFCLGFGRKIDQANL